MPDGDSLNWKLKGTWSRTVQRLVRSGAEPCLIAQEAVRMFAKQANEGNWKPLVWCIAGILEEAIPTLRKIDRFSAQHEISDQICEDVRSVIADHPEAAFMLPVVQRMLCNPQQISSLRDSDHVRSVLLSELAAGLLDHCVLQPGRQEMAREADRDCSSQFAYERPLVDATRRAGAKLMETFFNSAPNTPVRTPTRSVPLLSTDLERLNTPVTVLGGVS